MSDDPRDEKRLHGLNAASAGNLGSIDTGSLLGPCPSFGAELHDTHVKDPRTGRVERGMVHPVPFCTYFGETDPAVIERDVRRAQEAS